MNSTALELLWGGVSSFIAVCSFLVSVFAWRTSASSKHLDEKIELAISRFNDTLDAKLAVSFSSNKEVVLRFEMVQKQVEELEGKARHNADNIAMLMAWGLNGGALRLPKLKELERP